MIMKQETTIYVVDSIMGSGKTTAAIQYINQFPHRRFLYITPYLTEVDRIIDSCRDSSTGKSRFITPNSKCDSKLKSIKRLLKEGYDIVSTHALFRLFDQEVIDILKKGHYTLIMDEVADVIEQYDLSIYDCKFLFNNYVHIDEETNLLKWNLDASNYTGVFDEVKRLCDMGCLAKYNENAALWLFPVQAFNAFKEIFILTYMFDGQLQKYYYDLFGLKYHYLYVKEETEGQYSFTSLKSARVKTDYTELIHILDKPKLNQIGDDRYSLSKNWYRAKKGSADEIDPSIRKLKNNTFNFFYNICGSKTDGNLWTTFKSFKPLLSGKGYTKGFASCNCRATNEYRNRTNVAYLLNRYLNTVVKNFFSDKKIQIDEDKYALSEMLQFIWRSAIRDGKEINVYIPSSRMRKLLKDWIAENANAEGCYEDDFEEEFVDETEMY